MRRQDREITDRAEIDWLLGQAKVCRVAFAVGDRPYIVPLSPGYDAEANVLFFHTARDGRKIDCIEANPRVCFEVEGTAEVKAGDERGCSWSVRYESAIGYGTMVELVSPAERDHALRFIMRQQAGREADWVFTPEMLDATRVWRLAIDSVTGKRSFPLQDG